MEDAGRGSVGLFGFFVMQHQMTAMVYLGKMVHPETGKIERNLEGARFSIDLLGMLEEKTRGNLTAEESRLLEQTLTNLRLNYMDEVRREKESAGRTEGQATAPGPSAEKAERAEKAEKTEKAEAPEKTEETEKTENGEETGKTADGDEGERTADPEAR